VSRCRRLHWIILTELQSAKISRWAFPGYHGKPLSNMAMLTLLKRMNSVDQKWLDPTSGKAIVPHGFRASFRTWCEEIAHFPHSVVEEAMGHVVCTAVERAYRRTDVLEKRRGQPQRLQAWSLFGRDRHIRDLARATKELFEAI
jgi:integrase